MTIIIAGHNFGKNPWNRYTVNQDSSKLADFKLVAKDDESKGAREEGLFFVADSIITSFGSTGYSPLLSGFQKIQAIQIMLWKPHFIGEYFNKYREVFMQFECLVAFSGSTLTAQHVINSISNHLGSLKIDIQSAHELNDGDYIVRKDCDHNNLISRAHTMLYDSEMFVPNKHYDGLLTGDYIAEVVEHSINKALSSAQQYRLDERALREMYTDFILGVNCPSTNADLLIKYTMKNRTNDDGRIEVYVESERIEVGSVAVIGMNSRFGRSAQDRAAEAITNGSSLKDEMKLFVKGAIEEVNSEASFQIGMPMVVKSLIRRRISKEVITE